MKGLCIKEHNIIQAGGGGMCGVNCISIHTTGYEQMGHEIRENINAHIIHNWPIYKDSYEFPYTERVGLTNMTFKNELEFLNFLQEEDDASKLWMTHVDDISKSIRTLLKEYSYHRD